MPREKAKNSKLPGLKIHTRNLPGDVAKIIVKKQTMMMEHCTCQVGQTQAIYSMIREWDNKTET